MEIPYHLTCLLRNLYAAQEATVRTRHGKMDWFQIGKGICQGCTLSLCLFNIYAEYLMGNAGLDEHKLESRLAGKISIIPNVQMTPPVWQESEEEQKSHLMKVKDESEKVGLDLNIQKTNIMASSPITSLQIDGETMETAADFIWGGSKISADGNCSHEIKRHLPLGSIAMTNIESILISREITLSTKVCIFKAMVFPVIMYVCESSTIKKAECRRINSFIL